MLAGLIGGAAGPTINRLLSYTANPNAQKRVAKVTEKHPYLTSLPYSSLITGAVS